MEYNTDRINYLLRGLGMDYVAEHFRESGLTDKAIAEILDGIFNPKSEKRFDPIVENLFPAASRGVYRMKWQGDDYKPSNPFIVFCMHFGIGHNKAYSKQEIANAEKLSMGGVSNILLIYESRLGIKDKILLGCKNKNPATIARLKREIYTRCLDKVLETKDNG